MTNFITHCCVDYASPLTGFELESIAYQISYTVDVFGMHLIFYFILAFNATFSNISAILGRPVLVVEEAGVPEENHRPWARN